MVQIVDEDKLKDMMTIDSLENISMCENNEALGLQVKLHNACAWKVTILADIPERGAAGSTRPTRKRSAAEEGRTVVQSQHMYEIASDPSLISSEAGVGRPARANACSITEIVPSSSAMFHEPSSERSTRNAEPRSAFYVLENENF